MSVLKVAHGPKRSSYLARGQTCTLVQAITLLLCSYSFNSQAQSHSIIDKWKTLLTHAQITLETAPPPEEGEVFKPSFIPSPTPQVCLKDLWSLECQKKLLLKPASWDPWFKSLNLAIPSHLKSSYQFFFIPFKPIQLRGLLALNVNHPSPAPLYIIRGGISSEAGKIGAEKLFLFTVMEHLKAHVLFVGSSFQDDNLVETRFKNAGPVADYWHNYYLLQTLRHPSLRPLFNKFYLVGISMSGLGALWSSQFIWLENPHLNFDQIILLCPYIQFNFTISPKIYIPSWFWARQKFPRTSQLFSFFEHPLKALGIAFFSSQQETKILPHALNKGSKDFLKIIQNSSLSYSEKLRHLTDSLTPQAPIRLLYSEKDDLVHPEHNALQLKSYPWKIDFLSFMEGQHCFFYRDYPTEYLSRAFEP